MNKKQILRNSIKKMIPKKMPKPSIPGNVFQKKQAPGKILEKLKEFGPLRKKMPVRPHKLDMPSVFPKLKPKKAPSALQKIIRKAAPLPVPPKQILQVQGAPSSSARPTQAAPKLVNPQGAKYNRNTGKPLSPVKLPSVGKPLINDLQQKPSIKPKDPWMQKDYKPGSIKRGYTKYA